MGKIPFDVWIASLTLDQYVLKTPSTMQASWNAPPFADTRIVCQEAFTNSLRVTSLHHIH